MQAVSIGVWDGPGWSMSVFANVNGTYPFHLFLPMWHIRLKH